MTKFKGAAMGVWTILRSQLLQFKGNTNVMREIMLLFENGIKQLCFIHKHLDIPRILYKKSKEIKSNPNSYNSPIAEFRAGFVQLIFETANTCAVSKIFYK